MPLSDYVPRNRPPRPWRCQQRVGSISPVLPRFGCSGADAVRSMRDERDREIARHVSPSLTLLAAVEPVPGRPGPPGPPAGRSPRPRHSDVEVVAKLRGVQIRGEASAEDGSGQNSVEPVGSPPGDSPSSIGRGPNGMRSRSRTVRYAAGAEGSSALVTTDARPERSASGAGSDRDSGQLTGDRLRGAVRASMGTRPGGVTGRRRGLKPRLFGA